MQFLTIGLGFRRGVTVEHIEAAVRAALESLPAPAQYRMVDFGSIATVATLESKVHDPALVAFCARHRLPLLGFSAQDVQACFCERSSLSGSPIVRLHAGVEGVCEPCALLACPGGVLVRGKLAQGGVTVAIAAAGKTDRESNTSKAQTP
jgi:cobalamin biosynthesis protein CbiG